MPNFQAKRWIHRRLAAGRSSASAEAGFLLVEVIISAMLVGMIVVATITGFNVLDRSSSEQRRRSEAAVLAAESQEQLRSDSATTLLSFKAGAHAYTATVAGTTFTITQKASFGNGSSTTGCNVGEEGSKGKGTYILISSTVTWARMTGSPVSQSSVITPPTGSALEVKVTNGASTPTSGVGVAISYTAVESTGTTTIEGTTGSSGCVLFAGIPATSAKLKVRETSGIVNKQGTLSWPEEEITLAPNVLTPHEVVLAPGGSLTASFTYLNAAKYKHKQNNPANAEIEETVTGDTFVAENAEMKLAPNFQTGSNQVAQNFPAGLFEILPGAVGSYKATATTQISAVNYPKGNLFPFTAEKSWAAYAGDCAANDPEELTKALGTKVTDPAAQVHQAEATGVSVPTTYVLLNVYKESQSGVALRGTKAWEALETGNTSYPVTLTNIKCEGVKPDNETAINNDHVQGTTTGSVWGGHLEAPFQPFGEYEMCLYAGGKTYTPKVAGSTKFKNLEAAKKTELNIYLGELSKTEKETARVKSEGETKTARETTETTTRKAAETKESETQTKREGEEANTRKTAENKEAETQSKREAAEAPAWTKIANEEKAEKETKEKEEATKAARLSTEAAERAQWTKEYNEHKIGYPSLTQKNAKEATQTTNRTTKEAAEKTADNKRKTEESNTKTARTNQETTKKNAETSEAATETARIAAEATTRKNAEKIETTTETTRITTEATTRKTAETKETETKTKAVEKENTEIAAKEVVVESGKSSC